MRFSPEYVELSELSIILGKSDINLKGKVENFIPFVFEDKTTGKKTVKPVSEKPNTLHYITTGDINLKNEVFYKIILIDEVGEKTETTKQKLDIQ